MGSKATPYIANTASSIAKTVANVLPFGSCGDLATSSRQITAAKALRYHPNFKRVVGDRLCGNEALRAAEHHPNLQSRTYGGTCN